ncbi:altered inheritance of mitochondria protein 32-like [Cucurbita moschata]|uniref:Altered inheritance of mitochondria protein 32-like n=1 Tax=Cucurbita moschata TaxID=3662 RepID=A0A6J1EL21_CUCMO|nr:altered inheritance of mitochondria protein 32-like [Cucurbita moschata]
MRLLRPNRSLSSVGENLCESLFFFRSPKLSSSYLTSSPILLHSPESHRVSTFSTAEDEKYGFRRPEMYGRSLSGTVGAYERHVFLCYRSHEVWPSRVDGSDADLLPKLLSSAIKTRENEISVKTKLTICEAGEGTEHSDGDVLVFPEMIKYRGLKDEDVESFVEKVLMDGKQQVYGAHDALAGSYIFVCAHRSRDKRCGVCGTALITKLIEEIELRGLKDQICVHACSHIGGHKYAGNVIVFSPDLDGRIMGHWYGYVTPDDVPELLDKHIGKGELIERLWRGRMGRINDEEGKEVDEDKLPSAEVSKETKNKPWEKDIQGND